ncbi:MAG: hypothetical protein E7254_07740 [Lachnospiraceae bacterium]|nr:hypothetical protein [Lachnospiraceae bacterium]
MMFKKKSKFKIARENAEEAINRTNKRIEDLGEQTKELYDALARIQEMFDKIRNVPSDKMIQYQELKEIRLTWKQQAKEIENDCKKADIKNAGGGAAGVAAGVGVIAMGPTVAMGVATTFGVASTGTAISSLSGAAATNAALAWLGGGALAAGGGGMAAGEGLLALAGPIGWAIAGAAILTSGLLFWKNRKEKQKLESIFTTISERDVKSYELSIVELSERIDRIIDERGKLKEAIMKIESFGKDYNSMTEAQQYELGAYVNLMNSSTQLLVNPINGLLPKYSDDDFEDYKNWKKKKIDQSLCEECEGPIIAFANLLYKIKLDDNDKKLLFKCFKKNKKMLKELKISKKEMKIEIMDAVYEALDYQQMIAQN